jgi:HK97 family phage major capsid protein
MWAHRYLGPQDYVWFVNATVMPQLYAMTVGQSPVYVPPGGFSASPYGSLFGRPVIETEYNPYLGTVGDILLASPSQYALITKGGIESASSIHVKFVEDETAFRFVYRVDGEPIWASSVTAFDGTNTISPFVALAATT